MNIIQPSLKGVNGLRVEEQQVSRELKMISQSEPSRPDAGPPGLTPLHSLPSCEVGPLESEHETDHQDAGREVARDNGGQEGGLTAIDGLDGETIIGSSGFTAINQTPGSLIYCPDVQKRNYRHQRPKR